MTYEAYWRYHFVRRFASHSTERSHECREQCESEQASIESGDESFDIGENLEDVLRELP